jgi:hypothetical protein
LLLVRDGAGRVALRCCKIGADPWRRRRRRAGEPGQALAAEQLSFLFGLFIGVREFSFLGKQALGEHAFPYTGPAGLRMIPDVQKLGTQAMQGEFDAAFAKSFVSVLGDLTGLPAVQINRTITGVKAMAEGKTVNPLALAFGFQKQ